MPSQLSGLFRTLTWNDFPEDKSPAPGPGQKTTVAFTATNSSPGNPSFVTVANSKPVALRLADNLTVSVGFVKNSSWVKKWFLTTRSSQEVDDMLNHEQGHYNVAALITRDFFVDVMLLKSSTFRSKQEGMNAIRAIKTTTLDRMQTVQDLYDAEVHPEQNSGKSRGPLQVSWDSAFRTAFTQARTSGTQSTDGTQHKQRLIEVLKAAGKKV